MASGHSLPQVNFSVQGGTQGVLTNLEYDDESTFSTPSQHVRGIVGDINIAVKRASRAVASLVVRASDSRPEDLGSMPDATKYPPSAHGERAR
ncbi:hypothetical protein TNCV_3339621 [Trichonephila clavipes]|nr:hypothetical protein TNCV_3339621 [Trichonephila clavipes]